MGTKAELTKSRDRLAEISKEAIELALEFGDSVLGEWEGTSQEADIRAKIKHLNHLKSELKDL